MSPRQPPGPTALGKTLLEGSLWAGSARILSILQVFLLNILLARLLAPSDYGAYVIVLSIVSLGVTLGVFGLDQTSVRLVSEALSRGRTLILQRTVRVILVLAPIGGGVVALAYLFGHRRLVTGLFDAPVLAPLGAAVSLWLFAAVAQRQLAEIFRGLQDIRLATIFGGLKSTGILTSLSQIALIGVLYVLRIPDLATLIWWTVGLTAMIAVAAGVKLSVRLASLEPAVGAESEPARRSLSGEIGAILGIALPLLMISVLMIGRTEADIWLVGALTSSAAVASYGASVRLSSLVYTPLMVVSAALAPLLASAAAQGGRVELQRAVRVAAAAAFVPALVGAAFILLFAEPILGLLFGDFYRGAGTILRLLTAGHLINVLGGPNALLLSMRGEGVAAMWGMVVTVVYVVAAGWLLGRQWGTHGVAVASATGLALQNVIMTGLARWRLGVWTLPPASPVGAWRAAVELWEGSIAHRR